MKLSVVDGQMRMCVCDSYYLDCFKTIYVYYLLYYIIMIICCVEDGMIGISLIV